MIRKKHNIVYSEPIGEIMERPPRYLARVGTMGMFILMLLFVLLSWIIKYPDTIPAKIILTTENPPADIVAKATGRIVDVRVAEGSMVEWGQVLGGVESSANYYEAESLISFLDSSGSDPLMGITAIPEFTNLGEMQGPFSDFRKAFNDYRFFLENDQNVKKAESVMEEIAQINSYIRELESKRTLVKEALMLEERQFKRDSILNLQKVMADALFEVSRQKLIAVRIELQQTILEAASKRIELSEKRSLYNDHLLKRALENEKLSAEAQSAWLVLMAAVDTWKEKHLLISPVKGVVTFTRFWSNNQFVTAGETVLTVVPEISGRVVGKAELTMKRAGKVKEGQDVIIKLSAYPYLEFGSIKGRVSSTSLVPEGDNYVVEVELPEGMTSLYGIELAFRQNMGGVAEIVTEDYRLINKIIDPLRYMWRRNSRKEPE